MTSVEFNVEVSHDAAELVRDWFAVVMRALGSTVEEVLAGQEPLPAESVRRGGMACGPAGGVWGFVKAQTGAAPKFRISTRVYSEANLRWFTKQLETVPESAEIGFSMLNGDGMPDSTVFRVGFRRMSEFIDGWLQLHLDFDANAPVFEPEGAEKLIIDELVEFADKWNVPFGLMGDLGVGPGTALEECLATEVKYWLNIPKVRTVLRGYSWVTILPRELVAALGGISSLEASKAFAVIRKLHGGGAWLQATELFGAFDDGALERVWEALRPVLLPGAPQSPYPVGYGPDFPIIFRDAAIKDGE